ncbi:YolD-like family protein [Bacillus subtilis]|uniref:YolD-like family protein n=1 Tax=Bacillus subtilis TaxID=1423 RepID=UPI0004A56E24|nr:YolD-like family protein [Bacillus subtilis]CCU57723.1 unknown [Bacillus subtilis E1]
MTQGIYDKRWEQKFILPEQRAALLNKKREVQKIEKPILDEYQLEEMAPTICEAMNSTHFWFSAIENKVLCISKNIK